MIKKYRSREEKIELINEWNAAKEKGEKMVDFTGRHNLNQTTLYGWMKKLGHNPVADSRTIVPVQSNGHSSELRTLKIENQRLKQIVADQCLDIQALKEYAGRS